MFFSLPRGDVIFTLFWCSLSKQTKQSDASFGFFAKLKMHAAMKDKLKQFLESGKLELYVLNLLDEQQSKEVEDMLNRYPELQFVYFEMKNALDNYADKQLYEYFEAEEKLLPLDATQKQTIESSSFLVGSRFWVAASLISVLFNAFLLFYYFQERKEKESLLAQMNTIEQRFLAQQVQMQDEYSAFLHTHAHFVPLYQKTGDTQQKAVVVWNPQTGEVAVFSAWLGAPPEGYCYRLWAVDSGGKAHEVTELKLHTVCHTKVKQQVSRWMLTLEKQSGSNQQLVAQASMKG
jgi:hypothetical protein